MEDEKIEAADGEARRAADGEGEPSSSGENAPETSSSAASARSSLADFAVMQLVASGKPLAGKKTITFPALPVEPFRLFHLVCQEWLTVHSVVVRLVCMTAAPLASSLSVE